MKLTTLVLAVAFAAAGLFTNVAPAESRTTFGITYDAVPALQEVDGSIDGVAVMVDRPLWQMVNLAGVGSVTRGAAGQSQVNLDAQRIFVGIGPAIRGDAGRGTAYAHFVVGALNSNVELGVGRFGLSDAETSIDGRFGAGLDYPVGETWALRTGVDYDGELHLLAAVSRGF